MKPIRLADHRAKRATGSGGKLPIASPRAECLLLLEDYLQQVRDALELLPLVEAAGVAEQLLRARDENRTVYVLGNGGSAATASHAATDWLKPSRGDSLGGVSTVSLVDNVALLTAWANDTSFENVFAAQLESLLQPGDVVIAISGSGNSPNVLRAIRTARQAGALTIGLTGFNGGALSRLVDISVVIPCDTQGMIEDVHMMLVHALTVVLKQAGGVSTRSEFDETDTVRSTAG